MSFILCGAFKRAKQILAQCQVASIRLLLGLRSYETLTIRYSEGTADCMDNLNNLLYIDILYNHRQQRYAYQCRH
jgi:hypothetical protein